MESVEASPGWLASCTWIGWTPFANFSRSADFDLFGRGWSDVTTLSRVEARAVARSYRGEIPVFEKVSTLSNYRFALCFENTAFPGYVTEKIFDASWRLHTHLPWSPRHQGSGACGSFIDARDFRDFAGMESFIRALKPEVAREYLVAAAEFMSSKSAERFSQDHS